MAGQAERQRMLTAKQKKRQAGSGGCGLWGLLLPGRLLGLPRAARLRIARMLMGLSEYLPRWWRLRSAENDG